MDSLKIIENLPEEIFTDTYNSGGGLTNEKLKVTGEALFDEVISKSLASELLPNGEYDSTCTYVLSQTADTVVLIKRREGEYPILQEYIINERNDVMSFEDMILDVQGTRNGVRKDALNVSTRPDPDKPRPWYIIPVVVLFLLLVFGLYIFAMLVR